MKYGKMPEPDRVAKLPHYKGIPITYTTLVVDGVPQFKAVDTDRVWECKRNGKCSICGEVLDYKIAFMVTKEEADSRYVFENPNHEDCLRYAFNLCPWLYYSKATYGDTDKLNEKFKDSGFSFHASHPDRQKANTRPPILGIYICRDYKNVVHKGYRICKVGKAQNIEWIEGK